MTRAVSPAGQQLSLSTCWNSHRHTEGKALAVEARELGFEWIEVSHGTKISLLPGLLDAVAEGIVRVSSLHNFCPSPVEVMMDAPDVYEFTSDKEWERERAVSLTRKTIEMAARFGADRVVVHLGRVSMPAITATLEKLVHAGGLYSRAFCALKLRLVAMRAKRAPVRLERARAALAALLSDCEKHRVRLGIETRSHHEQIPNQKEMRALLDEHEGCQWIGAWHDFGHVQRQANLALLNHGEFLTQTAPRIIGCHIHDVRWPARDHRVPLSTGGVDFANLLQLVPAETPLVWELSPSQTAGDLRSALARWQGCE
ncbi:MAG TPA: hypothetical protein DIT13_18670 [Verrucomicrobiales bacterium]|nr:hypothetical protein [Verrucomicrobiales bacterium]HRJ07445.1 TIM barrel protein [Prosthecobacter sp.]HRK12676.1 TIM barrel protein [Prosthecobacter sp.]